MPNTIAHRARSELHVLVVDDAADTVVCKALLLCSNEHDVKTARKGFETIETAKRYFPHPDVAFLC